MSIYGDIGYDIAFSSWVKRRVNMYKIIIVDFAKNFHAVDTNTI